MVLIMNGSEKCTLAIPFLLQKILTLTVFDTTEKRTSKKLSFMLYTYELLL